MIGIFDSGLGGLTVVKEVFRQLPGHGVVYFGDNARFPYGSKGPDVVRRFAVQDAEFLIAHGADAIIVACNTASALAIDAVRAAVHVPVFEVVTPAVRKAAAVTKGRVGVIGTRGTIGSGVYAEKMSDAAPKVKVFSGACPLFVPLVEEGWIDHSETAAIARTYLRPLRLRRIDTLILGCTHYPFLKAKIAAAIGPGVRLIDPARETVVDFVRFLDSDPALRAKLIADRTDRFFASDRTDHFARIASRWLGREIALERAVME